MKNIKRVIVPLAAVALLGTACSGAEPEIVEPEPLAVEVVEEMQAPEPGPED